MRKVLFVVCFFITLLAADSKIVIPKDKAILEAKKAVHKLHHMMRDEVKSNLEKGVYLAAKFCAEESMEKIEKLNKKLGDNISIKRVSISNRNPASYPLKSEISIVKAFDLIEKSDAYMPKQIVQLVDDGIYKVYFPATMSSRSCKKCHGKADKIDKKTLAFFKDKYPNDKGLNFRSGQVRGAVVVTVNTINIENKSTPIKE